MRPETSVRPLLLVALWSVTPGCAPAELPPPCPGSEAPGTVSVFAPDIGGAEGLAFSPDGRLFISQASEVVEVLPDGTKRVFATVPKAVGVAWWDDALFVASGDDGSGGTGAFCAETRRGGVFKVTMDGTATLFASGIRAPNFLAVTPWDTLLVSDDCGTNTKLYEVSKAGVTTVFHDGIPSANGLGFDVAGSTLFAVSTFTDPAPLWRLPLNGIQPGIAENLHDFPGGQSPDGLALDAAGRVYVALNTGFKIDRYVPGTGVERFATEVNTPASIAFGIGEGFDRCSLYATSLFGTDLNRIRVGEPGLALRY